MYFCWCFLFLAWMLSFSLCLCFHSLFPIFTLPLLFCLKQVYKYLLGIIPPYQWLIVQRWSIHNAALSPHAHCNWIPFMLCQIQQFDLIALLHKRVRDKRFALSLIGGEKTKPSRTHKLIHACAYSITALRGPHALRCIQTQPRLKIKGDRAFAVTAP